MTGEAALSGVGLTALGMALVRAHESARDDRLFDDPYAAAFVAALPGVFPEPGELDDEQRHVGSAFGVHAVFRTRFYDEYLLAAARDGLRQVVLVAAGLDTRAFRLDWPDGVRGYEVDLPEVLDFKERVLAERGAVPRCARTTVPADLRGDWGRVLVDAGFVPGEPTAWLVEGLLVYLSQAAAERLLTAVTELSAAGSRVAFEHQTAATAGLLDRARSGAALRKYAALWQGGLAGDAADWLRAHGWRPTSYALRDLASDYGRPLRGEPTSRLLSAERIR